MKGAGVLNNVESSCSSPYGLNINPPIHLVSEFNYYWRYSLNLLACYKCMDELLWVELYCHVEFQFNVENSSLNLFGICFGCFVPFPLPWICFCES